MSYTPEIFGSTVVVVGEFNPAIFSPDWLRRNDLIGDSDHSAALTGDAVVVSRRVSVCETDWFHLQVLEHQLVVTSKGALTPALKDLAEGILFQVPHTPVTALGMNFHAHYQMRSEAERHKVGDVLAPKSLWEQLFDTAQYSIGLSNLQIQVQHGGRDEKERRPDEINVQVQPSNRIATGVFVLLNDHRVSFTKTQSDKTTAERAAAIVASDWEKTWGFAAQTFEKLLTKVLAA